MTESPVGYGSISLPHYTDHVLAERAYSAIRDFRHVGLSIKPPVKRVDVVEKFLIAFLAREAEKAGQPFELFSVSERQAVFTCWRTGERHAMRYDGLDNFQKVRALEIFADNVPKPVWKKKG